MLDYLSHRSAFTVKVQHAVAVFVPILQQLINFILCDGLAGAADDQGELLPVDVAIGVPVRTGIICLQMHSNNISVGEGMKYKYF